MSDPAPDAPETSARRVRRPSIPGVINGLAAVAVIALLLMQIVVVALRYVFSIGAPWASDMLTYLYFFIVLLPLVVVVLRDESVRVDVFSQSFPAPLMRLLDRFALLVLFSPAMALAAWNFVPMVKTSWRVLESSPSMGGLPGYFLLKTLAAVVFAILAIVALWLGVRRGIYRKGDRT